ncbi:MAG: DegT/DnrJ/EryC1/StrS family aminotransferase [Elusimicrobiota bacterium]
MARKVLYVDFSAQYAAQRKTLLPAIDRALARGEHVLGVELDSFEKRFARLCGVKHAIGVANGTDALMLVLRALGVGPGDEIVTAPNSFVASAAAIALVGATPVFADVLPDQTIDARALEKAITPRTRAVIPVHLTGKICDMKAISAVARRRGLIIIEDAAQAVGALYHGRPAGSLGRAACFSFHPLKNLNAAGDAGAIVTSDDALAVKLRLLRNHGLKSRDEVMFWGHNSRLDTLQASILNRRLPSLAKVTRARRRTADLYRKGLAGIVECPRDAAGCRDAYHLFVIQCDRRDELQRFLKANGVSTAVHYPTPIHLQAPARKLGYKKGDFPETERQSARILSLPVHQYLTRAQIGHVIGAIQRFYGR